MRIQPWMTAVASAIMLFAAQSTSWGQGPPPQGGGYAPYSTNDPGVLYPQGTPASMQPWPGISPYQSANIAQTTHYNSNGSWFKEILYRDRQYFMSLEATATKYRGPGRAQIGSPSMRINPSTGNPLGLRIPPNNNGTITVPVPVLDTPGFFPVDDRVFPFPALDNSNNLFVTVSNGTSAFPIRNASNIPAPDYELGVTGRWGYENEDGTGMMVTGWWGGKSVEDFERGFREINGIPVTQTLTLALGGQNLNTRYGNVPLDNGEGFFPFAGTGSTVPYDTYFKMVQSTEAGGINLSQYTQPLYKSNGISIRPLYGVRYLYVGEQLAFTGINSGLTYDYDDSTDDGTFAPDGALTVLYDQFEATLFNDVKSHIAGPEVGLRFDLGSGEGGFKIWAETIVGLNANYEEIQMQGNNIGDPLFDSRINGLLVPRMLDPANVSEFRDENKGTHLSPLFQQSIFADIDVFGYVPLLKNMDMFEEANLRLGYTFLAVGEVARPIDSVEWRGFPQFPSIRNQRHSWYAQQFNLAIDWTY